MSRAQAACLLAACLLAGCQAVSPPPLTAVPELPAPSQAPMLYVPPVEQEYRFQVGDHISVRSYYDRQFNQDVVVRPDGRISLLLVGDVRVVDTTPTALREQLLATYGRVVDSPDITVALTKTANLVIYLGGEVRQPAMQRLEGSMTVLQALAASGGALPSANLRQVLLLRRGPEQQTLVYKIDLEQVLRGEAADAYVQRHDIVHVPKSEIANLGQWVDQYINAIIPRSVLFNLGWIRYHNSNPVQVVAP
ncbi:MAG: polysaccharide export protein [Burkholderiaceae bacterium]|nr:polysaccharide export protein [Burkholderiaceae bacterium]